MRIPSRLKLNQLTKIVTCKRSYRAVRIAEISGIFVVGVTMRTRAIECYKGELSMLHICIYRSKTTPNPRAWFSNDKSLATMVYIWKSTVRLASVGLAQARPNTLVTSQ